MLKDGNLRDIFAGVEIVRGISHETNLGHIQAVRLPVNRFPGSQIF
jgi:hypothetical protein